MKITSIAAAIITLAGCQTAHLNEPVRTEFYVGCIMTGWPVSGCDCIEQGAFDNGAPAYIQPGDKANGAKFSEAANKAIPECREKTQQLMKDGLTPPKGDDDASSAEEKADRSRALRGH